MGKETLDHFKQVATRQGLAELVTEDAPLLEFRLLLNGGAFSRKTIWMNKGMLHVEHHIDDTYEEFKTLDELCNQTLIGEAIEKGAFWQVL
jgi:hypothetical protein